MGRMSTLGLNHQADRRADRRYKVHYRIHWGREESTEYEGEVTDLSAGSCFL